jgi:hypothetical protein
MNWRTDKIIEACDAMQDELPRAKRALCAARRSGRDRMFNAYLGVKRIKLVVAAPTTRVLDRMTAK